MTLSVIDNVSALRRSVAAWRADGDDVALVPTMGALHLGHMALVSAARASAARTVATIFVNPTQFGPEEDFATYPRDYKADLARLEQAAVDAVYMPSADEIYPHGFSTEVSVSGVTDGLEGKERPHFFTGVSTVVAKLLLQSLPDTAFFGEKDYQQLITVRRMVRDLDIPCRVEAVPTVRDYDGLALSSRNSYLSKSERQKAAELFRVLSDMSRRLASGASSEKEIHGGIAALYAAGFERIDYLAVCDGETLMPVGKVVSSARVLVAAWLGGTRLIDNVAVEPLIRAERQ